MLGVQQGAQAHDRAMRSDLVGGLDHSSEPKVDTGSDEGTLREVAQEGMQGPVRISYGPESKMDDGGLGLQSPPVRQIILWDEFGAFYTQGRFN
jgi:hypothetical protein